MFNRHDEIPHHIKVFQLAEATRANNEILTEDERRRNEKTPVNYTPFVTFMACVIFFKPVAEYFIETGAELSALWTSFTTFFGG